MNNVMKKVAIALVFLISVLSVAEKVEAARFRTCNGNKQTWSGAWTTMYLSTTSMPIGGTWDRETQYMMSEWVDVAGSNFYFKVGRDTNGTSSDKNDVNEINFLYKPNESYLGRTHYRYKCYWFFGTRSGWKEMDIHLNTRYRWTTSSYKSGSAEPYNFQLTMLHELGHALGLLHQDNRLSTMNTRYPFGGQNGSGSVEPHADDRAGVRILYPDSSAESDFSVSRYHHAEARVTPNKVLRVGPQRAVVTKLKRGYSYVLEFTVENLGTQIGSSPRLDFYISTNSYISSYDTKLSAYAYWSLDLSPGVYYGDWAFNVPNLAPGTYYIGYRLETPTSAPFDSSVSNNYVALVDKITIE